jgi:hypothetical protein
MKDRIAPFIALLVLGAVVTAAGIAQVKFGPTVAELLLRPEWVLPMPEKMYRKQLPVFERPRFQMPVYGGSPFDPEPPIVEKLGSVAT